ncbi:hypothetical protein C0J50_8821 [Silurus asotus]|uniref:Uncharacterized protein n=1 Tax=Silurus asotus TaxID=30991 RepID=A0AAD5AGB4_SILAS|nr:hypothetical protein C0J50_8821 [Silurus asotus]
MIPKTEWMKRIEEIIPYYWENQTQAMWRDEENLKLLLDTSMKYFKHTEDEAPSECSCVAPIAPVAISVLVAFVCSFAGFVI